MQRQFLNLTPHAIVLRADGEDVTVPPSGHVARVETCDRHVSTEGTGTGGYIPVYVRQFGAIAGLPAPRRDTICLVSTIVLGAVPAGRYDVMAPDTGPTAVRDGDGRIVAVTRLIAAHALDVEYLTSAPAHVAAPDAASLDGPTGHGPDGEQ